MLLHPFCPSVICFESKKSLRCTFPLIINKRGEENFRPQFISSLENWFSKTLCHRYNAVCVMVSIYSFQRRHFYLSQPFKRILCSLQTFHSIYHWLQLRPRDTGNHLPLRIIIFQSPSHNV